MFPAAWRPLQTGGLIRVGSSNDGGYLVSKRAVGASSLLLSMGLNDDWNFEADFRRRSGARVVCFDHSVNPKFWVLYTVKQLARLRLLQAKRYLEYRSFFAQHGVEHRRTKIGYDTPGCTSLRSLLNEFEDSSIFLKIDIEGSEYRILEDIAEYSHRLSGIVIEFHDVDLNRDRIDSFISSLYGFSIVFFHANNYGGVDAAGDPITIELALIKDHLIDPLTPGEMTPVITANDPKSPDIAVHFESSAQ